LEEYIAKTPFYDPGMMGSNKYRIAVCGLMHAGKSTIAEALVNAGYQRQNFAGPVKEFATTSVNNIFYDKARVLGSEPWKEKTVEDLNNEKERYRVLFQWIGNYGREEFGEDFWVDLFAATYEDKNTTRSVVDDLRYVNEGNFLRNRGYTIVRVERPEWIRIESIQTAYEKNHGRRLKKRELKALGKHGSESEVRDIKVDFTIQNNGTVQQLMESLRMMLGIQF
jgi:hypothetical protein